MHACAYMYVCMYVRIFSTAFYQLPRSCALDSHCPQIVTTYVCSTGLKTIYLMHNFDFTLAMAINQ